MVRAGFSRAVGVVLKGLPTRKREKGGGLRAWGRGWEPRVQTGAGRAGLVGPSEPPYLGEEEML